MGTGGRELGVWLGEGKDGGQRAGRGGDCERVFSEGVPLGKKPGFSKWEVCVFTWHLPLDIWGCAITIPPN